MIRVFAYILAAIYPIFVFVFLVILKIPPRYFSLFIILVAAVFFLVFTSGKKDRFRLLGAGLLGAVGLACFLSTATIFLKLYPVLMNAVMLASFAYTLFAPPTMIFRFATLQDKSIKGALAEKRIAQYCRAVTIVWCVFFIANGSIAAWTVFYGSDLQWSIYNGGISYILIGCLFAGELIVRKMTDKKMPKAITISQFTPNSRPAEQVLCYEQAWGNGIYKTWKDFLADTACLRRAVQGESCQKWILYADDNWHFLCAFVALLQLGKEVRLTANVSPVHIAEIRSEGGVGFLSDRNLNSNEAGGKLWFIPALLEQRDSVDVNACNETFPINADETKILMYTSGSTGQPKVIQQRLTEFENDNRFIISQWGEEWLSRKACATVSPLHIYGLLFGILLPFTVGVPFRRKRIETPEEFEGLRDSHYMLITVPAFLKRAIEFKALEGASGDGTYGFANMWIYTSGGVLEREVAEQTNRCFGFWPLEVYGSTETSGIAWRVSRNGLEWTPFANAEISLNDEGCLVIKSPYIKDPAGFTTADLATILPDGRFLLQGRADSVVKIEEKRVSLVEVETRLRQSGLVGDACAVALHDRRQYLAAALVLNEQGAQQFHGKEKFEIDRWFRDYLFKFLETIAVPKKWRYVQSLPLDPQGKKKKSDVEALFVAKPDGRIFPGEKIIEQTATKVVLDFAIRDTSDYFNDHFPQFHILPGVAQFELAVRFASRYLGTSLNVAKAKRLKFTAPILPDNPLRIELSNNDGTVSFSVKSQDGNTVYSSGSFVLGNFAIGDKK